MISFCTRFISFIVLFFIVGSLTAQNLSSDYSPFSRFGLGDFLDQNTNIISSLGHLNAAYNDPNQLNLINPASLGSLKKSIFESGLHARFSSLKEGNNSKNVWSGNLKQISIGFALFNPINEVLAKKKYKVSWGMSFNLVPYTKLGYSIKSEEVVGTESFSKIFSCDGGSYKFFWGNGIKYKDFSIGANLGFIFGKMNFDRTISLTTQPFSYYDLFSNSLTMRSFYYNIGAQYDLWLRKQMDTDIRNKEEVITIGLWGNGNQKLSSKVDTTYLRIHPSLNLSDTALYVKEIKSSGTMPSTWGIGMMYRKGNKLKLGLDFSNSLWSNYTNPAKPEGLLNSISLGGGVEFTPDISSFKNFIKRCSYRLGYIYQSDPRNFNGSQLKTQGITVGIGMPFVVARELAFINIGAEFGKLTGYSPITEDYIKINLTFSFNDSGWFVRRRFD